MEKLFVIGIDMGTTLSGVSYALLELGKVPRIQPVTRFSGQREESAKSKIRSMVCYDQDGNVISACPNPDPEINPMPSEIEDARREECFELLPRPSSLAADGRPQLWYPQEPAEDEVENGIPPDIEQVGEGKVSRSGRDRNKEEDPSDTPSRKVLERQHMKIPRPILDDFRSPVQVFTDFLQYLFRSAKEYVTETERKLDPTVTWSSIERNAYFVLTHPNGWEGRQQSQMRDAAVVAGLVNSSTAAHRIAFVAEGKASLHFCLDMNPDRHQERGGLLVVDCSGGTINISTYSQTEKDDFKEVVLPYCLQQGSILITSHARDYFNERSKDSDFESNDIVVEITARTFDEPEGVNCMSHDPNSSYFSEFKVESAQQLQKTVELFKMLNAHIEQASSLMTDSLSYRESPMKPTPLKTQITLQSGLANACTYIINDGIPPSDGTTISQSHGDMQPHTYTTTSLSGTLESSRKYLASVALELITAVGGSLEVLPPQYNEVLEEIVEASLELHKVFNESAMKLVTYTLPCDAEFDRSLMEDTEEKSEIRSGRVICTMEAGLRYRKREEWHVAVKAKVVLASTLDSILEGRK